MDPRWVLIDSEPHQPQAQRTVDRQLRKQSDEDIKALKQLCGTTLCPGDHLLLRSARPPVDS